MNIAILSREPNNYSTRRLVEVARARGHQVEVLDTLRCYMNIASHNPSIHYEGRELESYDAVIPRIGASITFYGTAVLRQFEMMNTMALNSSVAISRSRPSIPRGASTCGRGPISRGASRRTPPSARRPPRPACGWIT